MSDAASEEELNDLTDNIKGTCSDVQAIYEELRLMQTPEPSLRRRVDLCISLSGCIIQRAERKLKGYTADEEDEPWPDVGSILDSTCSLSQSPSRHSKCGSTRSSIHSVKRN